MPLARCQVFATKASSCGRSFSSPSSTMSSPRALLLCITATCTLLSTPHLVSALAFNFPDFVDVANTNLIDVYGTATFAGAAIEMTKSYHSAGRAVYRDPLVLYDMASGRLASFSSHFSFNITRIVPGAGTGDGMAFFLAPFPAVGIPPGSADSHLGLFNETGDLVAVEFDTYSNAPYNDPPSNHIGIDVFSLTSVATVELKNFSFVRDATAHVTVSYDGDGENLSVELSYSRKDPDAVARGRKWKLSYVIDFRKYLPDTVAVGFSAATGGGIESHTLLSWDFVSR